MTDSPDSLARVAVLGLGNVLMADDGFGPSVIHALQEEFDCGDVEVLDLGTPGLDLIPFLGGLDLAVIVDTVNATGTPGEVRLYDRDALLAAPPAARLSPHDPTLKVALLTAELGGIGPREVLLVGAIPEGITTRTSLSPAVAAAVPVAVQRVAEALERAGCAVRRRAASGRKPAWWQRDPAAVAGLAHG